jgi:hypothetical protein
MTAVPWKAAIWNTEKIRKKMDVIETGCEDGKWMETP